MKDIFERIKSLSPEKREIFEKAIKKENIDIKHIKEFLDKATGNAYRSITPVKKREYYPVTSPQKRLYVLQNNYSSQAYNVSGIYLIKGDLDINKLNDAFDKIIKKHEVFRTNFDVVNGEIIQKINEKVDFKVDFINLEKSNINENDIINDFIQSFDLNIPPLLRVKVIRKKTDEHLLMIDTHHIIADAISMSILLNDFTKAYQGIELEHLDIQCKDYAVWQHDKEYKKKLKKQGEYWGSKFNDDIPVLNLPTDYPRPSVQSFEGNQIKFDLDEDLTSEIKKICKDCNVTLYMFLLAIYNILLSKYCSQEDIVVGSGVSGRNHSELQNLVGMFVNTLALRSKPEGIKRFKDYLEEIKNISIGMYENQNYPFEDLVEKLAIKRDMSRNPIFDVMFMLQNMDMGNVKMGDLQIISYNLENKTSKFDLLFEVWEGEKTLECKIEYCTKLFKEETIKRFGKHFEQIVKTVLLDAEKKIKDIDIMSREEKKQILLDFNDTAAEYPSDKTIHELFEEQVSKTPDNTALFYEGEKLTYRELNVKSNQLASYLRGSGVKPDSIVGIMAERSFDMIIGILGILKSGGAYLPIDPDYPEERIKYMLEDGGVSILLSQKSLEDRISNTCDVINLDDDGAYNGNGANLELLNTSRDLAYVIYTSGSTGKPKGVMIEHRNVVRLLFNDKCRFDFNEKDIWTLFHSYSFDFSVWEMFGALLYGGKLIIIPKLLAKDTYNFLKLLKKEKVTILNQTPRAFYNIINEELKCVDNELVLRNIIFGGEALHPGKLNDWHLKYPKTNLINMYGITETTVHVTYKEITEYEINSNISNIGQPIPTLSVYIVDKYNRLQPIGVAGELLVGGEGVGRGYLNRPDLTKEKFIINKYNNKERLYKSGDLARWLPDGNIEYLGRIDFQVKIRGFRIELGEIESRLLEHEDIRSAIVLARENSEGEKYLVSYFVTRASENKLEISVIKTFLLNSLPDYMIPSFFVQLDEMPLTQNGKIDKKALPDSDMNLITDVKYTAPRNQLEKELAVIWEEILGVNEVGIDHNFFDLGGHSIKAVKMVSKANNRFKSNIKLVDLYRYPTISQLSLIAKKVSQSDIENIMTKGLKIIKQKRAVVENNPEYKDKLPEDYEDIYPLSKIQQGMAFFSQLKEDEPIYHDQFVYSVKLENFNVKRIRDAFKLISDNNSILRTSFNLDDFNEPYQIVHKNSRPELIEYADLSEYKKISQENSIRKYIENGLDKKFMKKNDLLWRMKIFSLGNNNYCIVFSCHHAILDGWSVLKLISDLTDIYEKIKDSQKIEIKSLKNNFKNYIAIDLSRKKSADVKAFWGEYLKNYERNRLPFNYSRKKIAELSGSIIIKRFLDKSKLKKLIEACNEYHCTLKELLLSTHVYLLSILTGENTVVTGVVTHNRPEIEDSENILGCFLNTVPIKYTINRKFRKSDFISGIRDSYRKIKENELFLVDIAEIVGDYNKDGNPVFDVIFNYTDFREFNNNTNIKNTIGLDLNLENNEMTNTFLDIEASRTGNGIAMQIKYAPSYFYSENIETVYKLFFQILDILSDKKREIIDSSEILNTEESIKYYSNFNNTKAVYSREKTLSCLFEEQVLKTPYNTALICGEDRISYRELNEKSNRFANFLVDKGVAPGEFIGIVTERNFNMIIGMLGILKAGGIYIPIDPEYPSERKEYIMEKSNISAIVQDADYRLECSKCITIEHADYKKYPEHNPGIKRNSDELAYVIFTSGSTGNPKGVMIEHHSIVNLIEWVNKRFNVNEDDRLLFITSMCFDLSVYDIFGILSSGGSLYIAGKGELRNPETVFRLLKEQKITFWDSVPSTLNHIIDSNEENNSEFQQTELRLVFMSGDWIPVNLPGKIKKYFPMAEQISLGGATEGTVWSNYYPIDLNRVYINSIPYGKPINNNRFYILDSDLNLVPNGVAGELYIGGDGVARGYINDNEKTKNAFIKDIYSDIKDKKMYRTGDHGRMLPDGNLEFLGRSDFQVKIRGYRVELGEIENVLLKHKEINSTVVIARGQENTNKELVAYYVSNNEQVLSELRSFLSGKLPDYMIPSYFIHLDIIPLTVNGKINRKALPEPEGNINTGVEYEAPGNKVEKRLADIWQEILEVEKVGIRDDFFELGGNSLNITSVKSAIHKNLDIDIPLGELFQKTTIVELSEYIENAERDIYSSINAVDKRDYYPVTSLQKRLYFLQRDKDITAYNMPNIFILKGELNISKIKKTFKKIIEKHEAFRTSFDIVNDEVVQKIYDNVNFKIEYIELEKLKKEEKDIITDFVRPFDLSKAPLLRVKILKRNIEEHLMMIDMHHIIGDGVSTGILINDFTKAYSGEELDKLRIQYKDYAVWQEYELNKENLSKQREYWVSKFSDEIPVLNLPTDYPRPAVQSFEGNYINFELDEMLIAEIKKICKKYNITLYMFLFSIYNILLSKYSGQEDIVVGSGASGRNHAEIENIVGMFINTLAIRSKPAGEKKFLNYLAEIKNISIGMYENQNYPFDDLVEQLAVKRDVSRNPVFDVGFIVQNMKLNKIEMNNLQMLQYDIKNKTSKVDLFLNVWEDKNNITCTIEYCTKIFKKKTIIRFGNHFNNLVRNVLNNIDKKIKDIDIISEKEKKKVLFDFNNTKRNSPKENMIHLLFEKQVLLIPNNIAVIFENKKITYKELNEKSNRLARYLRDKGVKANDILGIMMNNSLEMIIGILGILKSGGAYLPIDPDYPQERINYMLNDSNIKFLLMDLNDIKNTYEYKIKNIVNVNNNEIDTYSKNNLENINKAKDLIYVIYTSGSSGKPKGVLINHEGLVNFIMWRIKTYNFDENDTTLQLLSYSFDGFGTNFYSSILSGGKLLLADKQKIEKNYINKYLYFSKITNTSLVPSLLELLLENGHKILSSMRFVVIGGEKIDFRLLKRIKDKYPNLHFINEYGPTENTIATTSFINMNFKDTSIIGKPIYNNKIYILSKNNNLMPIGIAGELCVSGDGLARGYLNRPGLTRANFVENPFIPGERMYRTGDLARWLEDGNIEFLGRIDHQVKIRGFRVELGEIESCLLNHKEIMEAVVLAKEDGNNCKYLYAYYVSESEINLLNIRKHLSKILPDYMIPSYFIKLDKIPLTSSGKVNKKELPEPEEPVDTGEEYVCASNETEEKLIKIWEKVLNKERIGINDNFFNLGGHSLKAITLVSHINKVFNIGIEVSVLFNNQTIKEIAEVVKRSSFVEFRKIKAIEEREYYPVTSPQKRLYSIQRDMEKTAYNMPGVFLLKGELDINRINKAFKKIIEKHEAFRTCFEVINGEVVQKIHDKIFFNIDFFDLEKSSKKEKDIISNFVKSFDLSKAPLMRVKILKRNAEEHIMMIDMHHIIADGSSMGILIRDFTQAYKGEELEKFRIQYKDYAVWQDQELYKSKLNKQREFWLSKFQDEIPILNLHTDFPRPAIQSFEGNRLSFNLDEELTAKIYKVCKDHDVTLYMFFLSMYFILLSKYSGQEDIVVGSGVSGRNHAEIQGLVGMFVNTLALRSKPEGEKRFIDYLKEIKDISIGMYENQSYPFENLVEQIIEERDLSRNPIFDVMFVVQNIDFEKMKIGDLELVPYNTKNKTSKFDMFLEIWENEKNIEYNIEYCTELFKEETIKRFGKHFEEILRNIIDDIEKKIKEIEISTDEEKNKIFYDYNNTNLIYPKNKTIIELFEEQVEKSSENDAVVFEDKKLTYSELNNKSNQLARYLREKGVKKEDIIGLMVDRSLEMIIGMLGIIKAGCAYLPIDPNYPNERISFILEDSEAKMMLTYRDLKEKINYDIEKVFINDSEIYKIDTDNLKIINNSNDLIYVLYTSGSTGKPKGVMIEHKSLHNFIKSFYNYYDKDLSENDNFLALTNFTFDVSVSEIFLSLIYGCTLFIMNKKDIFDPKIIANTIINKQITFAYIPPAILNNVYDNLFLYKEKMKLNKLLVGVEPIKSDILEKYIKLNPELKIINGYGPTETTICASYYKYKNNIEYDFRNVPIGRPISNLKIYILDKYNKIQPIGVPGELCISGHNLARGYLNRSELTKEKFVESPFITGERMYRTGDLARWLEDGNIEFLGRIDQQVKVRGFRVELGEITSVINKHEKIKDSIVLAKSNGKGEKDLVSYIIPEKNYENTENINGVKDEHIKEWQDLFDDNYNKCKVIENDIFNISGWNSSYTDSPIESEAMAEWVNYTVENINRYNSKRVLEIGSGTGLLLFRIAKDTDEYLGTDFSGEVVDYVKKVLNKIDPGKKIYKNVELLEKEASDFKGIKKNYYDLIIINSVIQYFPDIDYFVKVIEASVSSIRAGGKIYIGDVRNLSLLETFQSSVSLYRGRTEKSSKELKNEIRTNIAQETELIIDPEFFYAIKDIVEDVSNVEIIYKRGKYDNELTKYRYDVVLHVKEAPKEMDKIVKDWVKDDLTIKDVKRILEEENTDVIEITGVVNSRLQKDIIDLENLIQKDEINIIEENVDIEKDKMINPEEFYSMAGEKYVVKLHYAGVGKEKYYNVVFMKDRSDNNIVLSFQDYINKPIKNLSEYANNPIRSKALGNLGLLIRDYLKSKLPEYMIPSYIIQIDKIPLNLNGKINIKALPDPRSVIGEKTEYEAPRNEAEEKLVKIWEEVLGIDRIGINDNFFDLGGHSLKAISLISHINKIFNTRLEVSGLFNNHCIKQLAEVIGKSFYVDYRKIEKAEKREYYPVTSPQKRLYSLQRNMKNTAYNMPSIFILKGTFDKNKIDEAFNKIIEKHEAFRTGFDVVNDEIVQRIYDEVNFKVEYIDIVDSNENEKKIVESFVKLFDLSMAPLMRVKVLKRKTEEHILMIDMHHIITDGTSISILMKDFITAYKGKLLDTLTIQYKDYALWGKSDLYLEELTKQREYWLSKFEDEIPVLNLPTDYPRPAMQSFEGNTLYFDFDEELTAKIRRFCKEYDVTLFMFLLAAYNILLSKYSGQEDIVVGSGVSGRNRAEIESLVGMFVNTLTLRSKPEGEKKFIDYLNEIKEISIGMYENQNYPFEDLVNKLVRRDVSRNPLFDVMFMLQNMEIGRFEIDDLQVIPYEIENKTSKFDILLNAWENEKFIRYNIEYCTKLFKKETIERFGKHFKQLIKNLVTTNKKKIKEIKIISDEEKFKIINQYNNTKMDFPNEVNIIQLFEKQAAKTPNNIAVMFEDKVMTYKDLNEKSNILARILRAKGVKPGVIVGIIIDRSFEMIIGILGILKSGGAYLPIDPSSPENRIKYMLSDCKSNILLTQQDLASLVPRDISTIFLDNPNIYKGNKNNLEIKYNVDDLMYIIFTSGSTGNPKGVMIEHKSVANIIFDLHYKYPLKKQDVYLLKTNYTFDVSVAELFGWFLEGGKLGILNRNHEKDHIKILDAIKNFNVTHINFVPSMLNVFLNNLDKNQLKILNKLKYLFVAGEAISSNIVNKFYKLTDKIKFENIYGPTESTIYASHYSLINFKDYNNVPIGKPMSNIQLYILNKYNDIQPIGVPGELCISGDGLARGYLNRPELTKEKFVDNPFIPGKKMYRTGDLARWIEDGNIEFLGRIDQQVKIRGFRIELEEIESKLLNHDNIMNAVVLVKADEKIDKYLCAYLLLSKDLNVKDLRSYLFKELPYYMIPSYFIKLDKIPLTSSGKIDKKALLNLDIDAEYLNNYKAPRNSIEKVVVEIFSKVLKVKKIGIYDNFFELGGNSLLVIRLVNEISDIFKIKLPALTLFEAGNIAELSEIIVNYETKPGQIEIIADLYQKVSQMSDYEVKNALNN